MAVGPWGYPPPRAYATTTQPVDIDSAGFPNSLAVRVLCRRVNLPKSRSKCMTLGVRRHAVVKEARGGEEARGCKEARGGE